ncbi:MAG: histidinol-phosphatase HisJ family protein [Clostridia bacterium]|nr:histidinol-phosphatase HisJ family protein [Clostridia bacterium]
MAYYSDFHSHSDISPDSKTDMVDLARAAADKGLQELCITDHWECGSPCYDWQLRKKPFDADRLLERFAAAQSAVGDRISLRLGLEIGNWTQDEAHAKEGLAIYPFDCVLCSLHTIKGFDAYFFDYGCEDIEPFLTAYMEECLELAQKADFDSFAHLTLPLRYAMIHVQRRLSVDHCLDVVDEVLKTIAQRGLALEANTSGFRTLGEPVPSVSILRRFRELGGELVTIGSDGHNEQNVGSYLEEAQQALREAGFKAYATFTKRKPVLHTL